MKKYFILLIAVFLIFMGCDISENNSDLKNESFWNMDFSYYYRFRKKSGDLDKPSITYEKNSACLFKLEYRDVTKKDNVDLERTVFNSLCSRYTIEDEEVNDNLYQSCITDSHVKHISFIINDI